MLSPKIIDDRAGDSSEGRLNLEVRGSRKEGTLWHISTVEFIPELVTVSPNDKPLKDIPKPQNEGALWHISTVEFIPELMAISPNDKPLKDIPKGSVWWPQYLSFDKKNELKEER